MTLHTQPKYGIRQINPALHKWNMFETILIENSEKQKYGGQRSAWVIVCTQNYFKLQVKCALILYRGSSVVDYWKPAFSSLVIKHDASE